MTDRPLSAPSAPAAAPSSDAPPQSSEASSRDTFPPHEPRNFVALALHQIVLRIGWIFKTESIIIPAYLDFLVGTHWLAGFLRGCLPVLNRLGQSVPPVLYSRRLKVMRRKKWSFGVCTLGMAAPFLLLACVAWLTAGVKYAWLPWLFLLAYGTFFVFVGMTQLSANTLQGKLIRPERRGRLMTFSTTVGAPAAILAAWLVLGGWLESPATGFALIFAASGMLFVLASASSLLLVEPPDDYQEAPSRARRLFAAAWEVIRADANFRRLALVAVGFSTVIMLFPHYQSMGRDVLGLKLRDLLWWVMVQNAGTCIFSLLAGPAADRRGNRNVLRWSICACAATPLIAVALVHLDSELGRRLFWLVFVPIGLTPVTIRTLTNYTLEIAPPAEHPRYVSTLNLCLAAPVVVFAPLIGLAIGVTGYTFIFLTGAAVMLLAGALTTRLIEPRRHMPMPMKDVGVGPED